jgi:hypothetical protein
MMAEKEKLRQAQFDRMMKAIDKSDESADKAAQRVPIQAGKWVRRTIVVSILFGVILAPFVMAMMNHPVVIQLTENRPEYLFGLFGGGTRHQFVEIRGYLMIEEVRQTLTALIGFYFGNGSGKINNN